MDYHSFFDAIGGIVPVKAYSNVTVPLLDYNGSKGFSDLSWRAALSYKTGKTLVYSSFSKGYNSGGFAGGAATDVQQLQPFRSEKLYSYEVGLKTDLLDRRLRFNTSAFYYDYRDLQVFVFDLTGPIPVQRKLNAGNAEIYGLEAEITVRPTRNFDLFGAVTLMHSEYKKFIALGGVSYSGNRLVNAPSFAFSGGVNLTVPLGGSGEIHGRVDGTYVSSIALFPDNAASTEVKSHGQINARLSWQSPSKTYEVAAWVKNLNSARYISSIAPVITQNQINYNDPRTFGGQLVVHF